MLQGSLRFFVNIPFIVNVLLNGVMEVVLSVDILKNEMHQTKHVNLITVNLVVQQKIYGYGMDTFPFLSLPPSYVD